MLALRDKRSPPLKHLAYPIAGALALAALPAAAQTRYDPAAAFAPLALPSAANKLRGANGLPGPGYWQNRSDYQIHATLDPAAKRVSGTATITYTNNSPDRLDSLWLQLDQNLYRPGSRGAMASGRVPGGTTDGMVIEAVELIRRQDDRSHAADLGHPRAGAVADGLAIAWQAQPAHPLSFHHSRRMGRSHGLGQGSRRRGLQHRAMVSAHGGL